ncbi:MAG: hypothetical protein AAGN66_29305 [Acidobacteriota bacterium]
MPQLTIDQRLRDVQRRLGVRADGILGPKTLSALERMLDSHLGPAPVEANLTVSRGSLDALVRFEISSFAHYERKLSNPIWPGAQSGVTIGIGYDLGHTSAARVERDWRGRIPDADLDRLLTTVGFTGVAARALVPGVADIQVPLAPAREVFFTATLPHHANITRRVYPGIEALPADAQGALLSLVFNRGGSMRNHDRRREMRDLRPLVAAGDLAGIAVQIRSMKRLWDPQVLPGLHRRRDREADLVVGAVRAYSAEELVGV